MGESLREHRAAQDHLLDHNIPLLTQLLSLHVRYRDLVQCLAIAHGRCQDLRRLVLP